MEFHYLSARYLYHKEIYVSRKLCFSNCQMISRLYYDNFNRFLSEVCFLGNVCLFLMQRSQGFISYGVFEIKHSRMRTHTHKA